MIYECERQRVLQASIDHVWEWLQEPQHLFAVNLFHRRIHGRGERLRVGSRVVIEHSFGGLVRQRRVARIRAYRRYHIAWGELAETGSDWFPHSQSLTLRPLTATSCILSNRLRGQFRLPGADYWLLPLYRWVGPWIVAAENRTIAQAMTR